MPETTGRDATGREVAAQVRAILAAEAAWTDTVLNLSPAEGLMSRGARRALDSDLAARLSEGLPWAKDQSMPAIMHRWSAGLEQLLSDLVRALFGARHVDWRPVSNTMANAAALLAMTHPGDRVAVQSLDAGGNMSYQPAGVCGLLGLETLAFPGTADFSIDVPAAVEVITSAAPRVVVLGGSKVLFRYPVPEIAAAARSVGADVLFDAAHVGPLIAAGRFNQPLAEGATVMTLGTHKLMGGPVGGLVMTNDDAIAERVYALTEPRFLQTRDINKYAASAIALAELLEFRLPYAQMIQRNVAALSAELARGGVAVVGSERGWSQTHMLMADVGAGAKGWCEDLAANGILVSTCSLPGGDASPAARSGLRMSVAQLTRRGMGPDEMRQVATLIRRVMTGRAAGPAAAALAGQFTGVQFSFDDLNPGDRGAGDCSAGCRGGGDHWADDHWADDPRRW